MARKRLISPEFFTHPDIYEAEAATGLPLRLAFTGLWTQADKRGIFRWQGRRLKLAILPYDPVDFETILVALERHGFVRKYTVAGQDYGLIPSFIKHQTFHRLERPSDDPPPPDAITGGVDLLQGREPSGWIPRSVRDFVMERDAHQCVECRSTENLTLDHIVAYSAGGSNTAENLRVLCRSCNSKKGSRRLQPPANNDLALLHGGAMTARTPVAVAVASTDTSAVAVAVADARAAGPHGPPSPAANSGAPMRLGDVDWRAMFTQAGASPRIGFRP